MIDYFRDLKRRRDLLVHRSTEQRAALGTAAAALLGPLRIVSWAARAAVLYSLLRRG